VIATEPSQVGQRTDSWLTEAAAGRILSFAWFGVVRLNAHYMSFHQLPLTVAAQDSELIIDASVCHQAQLGRFLFK